MSRFQPGFLKKNIKPGSQSYLTAGTYTFTWPDAETVEVYLWGGGGSGVSGAGAPAGTDGGASTFAGTLSANGGKAGSTSAGGAGGTASGGDTNTSGSAGNGPATTAGTQGKGGNVGGSADQLSIFSTDGLGGQSQQTISGPGYPGGFYGGGGGSSRDAAGTYGGGGGGGGYVKKTYKGTAFATGSSITVVVGAGGVASSGYAPIGGPGRLGAVYVNWF